MTFWNTQPKALLYSDDFRPVVAEIAKQIALLEKKIASIAGYRYVQLRNEINQSMERTSPGSRSSSPSTGRSSWRAGTLRPRKWTRTCR
jgi:hypothetical protein